MPEADVFHRRQGVPPEDPGEPGDPLAGDRIPLVGHRGGTFLSLREILLRLEDLGPLEMPDLRGELLERAPASASTDMYSACLSRWSIWVDTGARSGRDGHRRTPPRPGSGAHTCPRSRDLPMLILSTADRSRSMFRRVSSSQRPASVRTWWALRVSRASSHHHGVLEFLRPGASTSVSFPSPPSRISPACFICTARHVSSTSDEVIPR